jgi:hypothetical protein
MTPNVTHLVMLTFNLSTGIGSLSVDNGTPVTASLAVPSLNAPFMIGTRATLDSFLDGWVDEAGIWKRQFTSGDKGQLWNGGAGTPFSSFTA